MIPRYRKITTPKNSQYELRPNGSLLCGPGCFSSMNVLKQRYVENEAATKALKAFESRGVQDLAIYECEYCSGYHLTSVEVKRKKKR